jgi:hypothetical protein
MVPGGTIWQYVWMLPEGPAGIWSLHPPPPHHFDYSRDSGPYEQGNTFLDALKIRGVSRLETLVHSVSVTPTIVTRCKTDFPLQNVTYPSLALMLTMIARCISSCKVPKISGMLRAVEKLLATYELLRYLSLSGFCIHRHNMLVSQHLVHGL